MKARNLLASLPMGMAALALVAAAASAAPRQPMALPAVGATFTASYDGVWDATLQSLGVVKALAADKATGRIETEAFPFAFVVGGSQNGNTQVIWVALRITLIRAAEGRTTVQVEPRIEDSLLNGFTPGPTNNPWADLFGRIEASLKARG
jgi:hypothetical protein